MLSIEMIPTGAGHGCAKARCTRSLQRTLTFNAGEMKAAARRRGGIPFRFFANGD